MSRERCEVELLPVQSGALLLWFLPSSLRTIPAIQTRNTEFLKKSLNSPRRTKLLTLNREISGIQSSPSTSASLNDL